MFEYMNTNTSILLSTNNSKVGGILGRWSARPTPPRGPPRRPRGWKARSRRGQPLPQLHVPFRPSSLVLWLRRTSKYAHQFFQYAVWFFYPKWPTCECGNGRRRSEESPAADPERERRARAGYGLHGLIFLPFSCQIVGKMLLVLGPIGTDLRK